MPHVELHIRECMLYEFDLKHSAAEATRNICVAYGEDALTLRTCQYWFARFRSGQKDLSDEPHTGRPIEFDQEALRTLIEDDPRQSTKELAGKFSCSKATIDHHLHAIGKTYKHGVWVPHEMTPQCKFQRSSICASLLSRQDSDPFLDRIVTGDEKWVLYVNQENKNQWLSPGQKPKPVPKPDLHPEKVLLSIWWNLRGIVYWELLESGATVTAEVYCKQLERVQEALIKKHPALVNRKKVVLLHDNARPHVAKVTQKKIQELGWEVLPHPAYSPDLAPTDYHLFRSMQHHLAGKHYKKEKEVETILEEYFHSKSEKFYSDGIRSLPKRWQEVVDNNGDYIVE